MTNDPGKLSFCVLSINTFFLVLSDRIVFHVQALQMIFVVRQFPDDFGGNDIAKPGNMYKRLARWIEDHNKTTYPAVTARPTAADVKQQEISLCISGPVVKVFETLFGAAGVHKHKDLDRVKKALLNQKQAFENWESQN